MASIGALSFLSSSRLASVLDRSPTPRKPAVLLRVLPPRGRSEAGSDGGVPIPDDPLEISVERSKNVAAVQDDLLRKISERKKRRSSVKKIAVGKGKDIISPDLGGVPLQDSDIGLKQEDSVPTSNKMSKRASVGLGESAVNMLEENTDKSNGQCLVADALVLSRELDSVATDSMVASPSVPKDTESQVAEIKKLEESIVEDASIEPGAGSGEGNMTPLAGPNVMNVILVAAECAPWSKAGGLGDVAGSLPKALANRGHRVMVVSPRYGNYPELEDLGLRRVYNVHGQDMEVTYHRAFIDGVDFVFLESALFRNLENDIYGGQRIEILKRMILLCKAAVEVPWYVPCAGICYGDGNLVFIANDWHTALLPVYLKAYYRDNGLMMYSRSVLAIHNIAHQGRGPLDEYKCLGLPDHYFDYFKLYDPVGGEHLNIFAAGLKAADRVVTVSQSYAWELKTMEGGWGLHNIISENDWKLEGIVNGIDTKDWNPEFDVHLKSNGYTNYTLETLHTGKPLCKAALQRELALPVRDVPLLSFIGRLDGQKGVDIIAEAIPWMVGQDVQLVLLGTGRKDLEEILRKLEGLYHDKVIGRVAFSVKMAHRITAGADIILMPSRFEPCGLNQLYAMMYGTIPVVHAVGGLRDTVKPFDPFAEDGHGWTFDRAESNGLIDATRNCLDTYWNYKSSWEGLQRRGMTQDLSWDKAAQHYEEVLVAAKYQW